MGRVLRPLSALHLTVLEEVLGDELWSAEPELVSLDVVSQVCSSGLPGAVALPEDAEERGRYLAGLGRYDLAVERAVWAGYMEACYFCRPETRRREGGQSADWRSSWLMIVCTRLVRHGCGPWRELWEEVPVGELLWRFEAMREQVDGESWLMSEEPVLSPEEEAREAEFQKVAQAILRKMMPLRMAAQKIKGRAERKARIEEVEREQGRLMRLAREGKLTEAEVQHPTSSGQRPTSNVQHPTSKDTHASDGGAIPAGD